MPLIATGFTRLLGMGIPCGETLLSVTAVFDHVVGLPIGCNYPPALLQVPLKYLREAKQACIFKHYFSALWTPNCLTGQENVSCTSYSILIS